MLILTKPIGLLIFKFYINPNIIVQCTVRVISLTVELKQFSNKPV